MWNNIQESWRKIKAYFRLLNRRDIYLSLLILLIAFASFGLGRLADLSQSTPLRVEYASPELYQGENNVLRVGRYFIGSRNSNKYHFPWCSGAERIKEENRLYFESREAAEEAGYTPAQNCKGL